jgi:hypothetical protein
MPRVFEGNELFHFLVGTAEINKTRLIEDMIFTKAVNWEYEQEWRVLSLRSDDRDFEDISFLGEELSAVYFGCRTSDFDRKELFDLAKSANLNVRFFQGRRSRHSFALKFTPVYL